MHLVSLYYHFFLSPLFCFCFQCPCNQNIHNCCHSGRRKKTGREMPKKLMKWQCVHQNHIYQIIQNFIPCYSCLSFLSQNSKNERKRIIENKIIKSKSERDGNLLVFLFLKKNRPFTLVTPKSFFKGTPKILNHFFIIKKQFRWII